MKLLFFFFCTVFAFDRPKLVKQHIYEYSQSQDGRPSVRTSFIPDIDSNLHIKHLEFEQHAMDRIINKNNRHSSLHSKKKNGRWKHTLNKDDKADPVLDRIQSRRQRFNIVPESDEHPCFAGFNSATSGTGRCGTFIRPAVNIGDKRVFRKLSDNNAPFTNFTLWNQTSNALVWEEDGANIEPDIMEVAYTSAYVMDNEGSNEKFVPHGQFDLGGQSWLEEMCLGVGIIPFDYTCSNKIQILVIRCGFDNAFVNMFQLRNNYPDPANENSTADYDNIFYLCAEHVERGTSFNPYDIANTMIHELAHVIQAAFGESDTVSTEGGATWVESTLLGLPFRPMVYAWGFPDWNKVFAVNIYDQRRQTSARKFYQMWATMLAFMAQDDVLGSDLTLDVWRYRAFDISLAGREIYDYFLQPNVLSRPPAVDQETSTDFMDFQTIYRVAMVGTCFDTPSADKKYSWPNKFRYWDCSTFPSYRGHSSSSTGIISQALGYGGAHAVRLMDVQNPRIEVDHTVARNGMFRTLVLAEERGSSNWTVSEIGGTRPSSNPLILDGDYSNVFVLQINTDPLGEFIDMEDLGWKTRNGIWITPRGYTNLYPNDISTSLSTTPVTVPTNGATLKMDIQWTIEDPSNTGEEGVDGCLLTGWDGFQIRVQRNTPGSPPVVLRSNELNNYTIYAFVPHYDEASKIYNVSCEHFQGWAGSSGGWKHLEFSLDQFIDQEIVIEIFFASDGYVNDYGVDVDNVTIVSGNEILFLDDAEMSIVMKSTVDKNFSTSTGLVDETTRVPYLVNRNDGYITDRGGYKIGKETTATFNATWSSALSNNIPIRSWLGPGYSHPWNKPEDPSSPPIVIINPWFEVWSQYHPVWETIKITEVIFYFLRGMLDVQELVLKILSVPEHTVLVEQRMSLGPVFMESIQRFVLSTPLEVTGCSYFMISISIVSGMTDPLGEISPSKQHVKMSPSANVGHPDWTWLHFTENSGNYTAGEMKQDPWDGRVVPVRILTERASGTVACVTNNPTNFPTNNPTKFPTRSPTNTDNPTKFPTGSPTNSSKKVESSTNPGNLTYSPTTISGASTAFKVAYAIIISLYVGFIYL